MMSNPSSNPLVLGIDTGGTYTDGVLLEYDRRRVLAAHKSLTTKRDFSIGIEAVIDGIHIDDPAAIKMVSVSTTLATNAIAEGKGKRVALLLIGYDPDLIRSFDLSGRFATPHFYYFAGGHDHLGREKEALDLPGILAEINRIQGEIDALAVSAYFSPLNPEHELRAFAAISAICDLPIVLGHQLSTKLGSVERATTAALNASLLAALQDFIIAVRRAMERRRIEAPLMVVRGDGTLMSDAFAARTPVETIHSGPAASAIGGRFLSRLDDALVIDIGGTTTDLALVERAEVSVSEEGATVAGYKTAVRAADLLSIALGGDSHITRARDKSIAIGPERVTPLSYLAFEHPQVEARLQALAEQGWGQAAPASLEYWYLLREPAPTLRLQGRQKELVDLLRAGPLPVPAILEKLKALAAVQLGADDLFRRELIARSGLTPTDLLHSDGRFSRWSNTAAAHALHAFARMNLRRPDEVREQVWRQMTEIIVRAVVTFLSGKDFSSPGQAKTDLGRWFFSNSLYDLHPHLRTSFHLDLPIIGIGAPAGVFLHDVAAALHTDLILPEFHEVANAVGAVAGSVMVSEELLVYPRLSRAGLEVLGFYVQTNDGREEFEDEAAALAHARRLSQERALGAALRSGADNPQVTVEERSDGLDSYRIRARAIGNPRLAK